MDQTNQPISPIPQPTQPQSVQPPINPSKSHAGFHFGKLILIVLGIVIIIGLIGGAYYLGAKRSESNSIDGGMKITKVPAANTPTPTPDPTANWKTYPGNGFTFLYPSTWIEPQRGNSVAPTIWLADPNTGTHTGNGGSIIYPDSIQVSTKQSTQTIKAYIDSIQTQQIPALASDFQRKTISINGQQVEVYHQGGEGTVGWYIPFSNGKMIVDFGPLNTDPGQDSVELQVVKSFKFTQ